MAWFSCLRGDAGLLEDVAGRAARQRHRQQHVFDRDELVAGLLRQLLGLVEQARGLRREIDLSGATALDFRQLGELTIDRLA